MRLGSFDDAAARLINPTHHITSHHAPNTHHVLLWYTHAVSFVGRILSYPSRLPWEFTSERPIRSVFPLYPIYGVPISLLKWFYTETGTESPPAELVYYVVRGVMFLLSFVLEDWAVHDLVPLPRHRRVALVLVASSYVTWTHQTHTFSNSLETLLVAWGLVLINRIIDNKVRSRESVE